MITVKEFYDFFDKRIPKSLSCEWDNDGLLCVSDTNNEVKRVLITLDITDNAIEYAIKNRFDTIISHHPLIFKGIKALNPNIGTSKRLIKLIKSDITAMSFHTRLDAIDGGVNDALCELFELTDIEKFGEMDMGRVGSLPSEMSKDKLAMLIKTKLGAPYVNYNGAKDTIRRLAVLGGAGDAEIYAAVHVGADAYLTGELSHHDLTDACDTGISLFAAGHHYSEFPVCIKLYSMVSENFPTVEAQIYNSINYKCV